MEELPTIPGSTDELGAAESSGAPEDPSEGPASQAPEERRRRRFVPRLRTLLIALLIALPLAAVAGIAYATYDYSEKYDGKILPGATIAGVDVGGMTRAQALRAVRKELKPQLSRTISVTWKKKSWEVTPQKLGARSNAPTAVEKALDASGDTSMFNKAQMKFLGRDLDFTEDVGLTYPKQGAISFIEGLASDFDQPARDAAIDYSSGWVKIVPHQVGREIDAEKTSGALLDALRSERKTTPLDVSTFQPKITKDDFDQVLLLRQSEHRLYFYQDGKITHDWLVATGQPAYPTPTGLWHVTELRYMPTWVNPAPDGWGSDMPATIGPGYDNPLGLRAINWDASGIRFHGTSNIGSLGTSASHGCVRMSNDDVIELYDMVEVGTPIVSTY
jgi:L,D-transpeptidase catalytic domain/Putative peptidoglycan binding domain